MKSILKKSLTSLALTACITGAVASISSASISWDSNAHWVGMGGLADVNAYTAQNNEPWNYHIRVEASTNDGSGRTASRNPASATDSISVSYRTTGPASSGTSLHEWIMNGDDAVISKNITFQ